jgi:fructose-bisphosphate aldolase class II
MLDDADDDGVDPSAQTSAPEAIAYVERSGVDFLAISIGTVHGHGNGKSRLDLVRLARLRDGVEVPFVIHGGSGLTEQQYHRLIDQGVAKINYFTALADAAVSQIKANLSQGHAVYREAFANVREVLAGEVRNCMRVWRSAGRAAEVLMQCSPWQNVEHVIVYDADSSDPFVIEEMLRKGKQQLSTIPGVLDVQIGKSVNEQSAYRYCWLIRFAHRQVIESYKTHQTHVSYADTYFRPIASGRITNDYEIDDDMEVRGSVRQPSMRGA